MQDKVFYSSRQGSLLRANELVQTKLYMQLNEESLPITYVGCIYQAIQALNQAINLIVPHST